MYKKIIIVLSVLLIGLGVFSLITLFFKGENESHNYKIDKNIKNPSGKVYVSYPLPKDDKDFDGVVDEVEKKIGTSSETNDTDVDGLSDKLEIEKYKTDPTKFDTDGDGYGDGVEVVKEYNPNGVGKIKN